MIRKYYKKIKNILTNNFKFNKITFKFNYKWFGNEYGGFYICPDILNKDKMIIYSFGIGEDISFDLSMIEEYYNCEIFAFDPTPKSINWINNQNIPNNFKFYPYGINYKTGIEKMFLPINKSHVSGSVHEANHLSKEDIIIVNMKCIEDIIKDNSHDYIDIIKMDIEGSEFNIIKKLNYKNLKCGQLLIEFHERFFKKGKSLLNKTLNILRKNNFYCFAISGGGG